MSTLLIVGASARAAAASARRAGFTPWCADLFADADLRAMVPDAVRCPAGQYPNGLAEILRDAPEGPWLYTGGLENHPNLVREMADARPLWGNGPNALVASRSPFTVERFLREDGLPVPEVLAGDAELPAYCRWLRKPLSGSAGRGIAFAELARRGERDTAAPAEDAESRAGTLRSPAHYYQQFIDGTPMSAVFARARGDVRLLGVTEQLIGEPWLNAPAFRYAGNIGPVQPSAELRYDLLRLGLILGDRCDLRGLFGVDFILHAGRPWVVEVNPRYTASVEVLELATGLNALEHHRLAFDVEAGIPVTRPPGQPVVGKAVLYADRRLVVPPYDVGENAISIGGDIRAARHLAGVRHADIPSPGEVIEEGWPILTVLGEGKDREQCLGDLIGRAGRARAFLYGNRPTVVRTWYGRLDDPDAD